MITREMRLLNSITEIEISDCYDAHQDLFEKGITVLYKYLDCEDDFSDDDRELLEKIYIIVNNDGRYV